MPQLFIYLLKLSCGLSVVYLFYRIALQGLTFYAANRWYLLLLSSFCFVLPLIDLSTFFEPQQLDRSAVVRSIPVVNDYVEIPRGGVPPPNIFSSFGIWEIAMAIWAVGSLLLLLRLFITYLSYRNIQKEAQLLPSNGIRLFQVNRPILPFSFGNAIFLNQEQ